MNWYVAVEVTDRKTGKHVCTLNIPVWAIVMFLVGWTVLVRL